ncbi:MAG: hypothetical protein IPK32_00120 [Verrucomicrobiaceae bacterium]|nr:hypothetical protein [Verrucomicrobiaceae bacterium]
MYLNQPISTVTSGNPSTSIGKWIVRSFLALVVATVLTVGAGLLYIRGQTLVETVYPNVSSAQLADIEKLTGITFPSGSIGLGYEYDHWTCIDPSMTAKVRIPSNLLDEFRTNKLLSPKSERSNISADFPLWWKPDELTKIAEGEYHTDAAWVQWTLGTESNDHVIYIYWAIY